VGRLKCSGATTLTRYEPSLLTGSFHLLLLKGCVLDGTLLLQVARAEPVSEISSFNDQRQVS